jgi:hypothetical protein
MARRRKSRKMITRRRRSGSRRYVGAVSVNEVLGLVGGAVASRIVVNMLAKQFPKLAATPTTKAAVQIGLGFVTKPIAAAIGSKSPIVDALGKGMIIAGGYELVKQVAPTAMGATDESDVIVVSGMDDIGANDISELNGMDDIGASDDEISEINGMDDYDY